MTAILAALLPIPVKAIDKARDVCLLVATEIGTVWKDAWPQSVGVDIFEAGITFTALQRWQCHESSESS